MFANFTPTFCCVFCQFMLFRTLQSAHGSSVKLIKALVKHCSPQFVAIVISEHLWALKMVSRYRYVLVLEENFEKLKAVYL